MGIEAPATALPTLRGVRVLVTGASGFIGRHVCERLVHEGAAATGVTRRGVPPVLPDPLHQVEWRQVDLAEEGVARRLVDEIQPQVVINLGGMVTGSRDRSVVDPMRRVNLDAVVALLDAATESGRCEAFVQAGSLEEPDRRDEPPSSPYAASKLAATRYVQLYGQRYDLSCSIARIFMVYGPGPQDEAKLIPYLIRQGLDGKQVALSSGLRRVDWVYVNDVADALLLLARRRDLRGESVDIGAGELVPIRDVVSRLWGLLDLDGQPPFGTLPDRPGDVERVADSERTHRILGFTPGVNLADGLAATVAWFRSHGDATV